MAHRPLSRNVLLKLSYNGSTYHGFSYQPGLPTVEWHIFNALFMSKLLPNREGEDGRSEDRRSEDGSRCNGSYNDSCNGKYDSCSATHNGNPHTDQNHPPAKYTARPKSTPTHPQAVSSGPYAFTKDALALISSARYSKCGRTDAGVSASSQFVSLFLLASRPDASGYPYDLILNTFLPDNIRILGWMFVEESFSARFSCTSREYEYYFVRGALDIEKMQEASQLLIGTHWFGRLSKPEKEESKKKRLEKSQSAALCANSPEESVRTVDTISFTKQKTFPDLEIEIFVMKIKARSFLHNQVRKIFSLLQMVGAGSPVSVKSVLNKSEKQKTDILLASPFFLVLSSCTFKDTDLHQLRTTPDKRNTRHKILENVLLHSEVSSRIATEPRNPSSP